MTLMNVLKDFENNDFYKCVLQFLESMLSEFLLRNAKSMLLAHYAMWEVDQGHAHAIISLSLLCITLPFHTLVPAQSIINMFWTFLRNVYSLAIHARQWMDGGV